MGQVLGRQVSSCMCSLFICHQAQLPPLQQECSRRGDKEASGAHRPWDKCSITSTVLLVNISHQASWTRESKSHCLMWKPQNTMAMACKPQPAVPYFWALFLKQKSFRTIDFWNCGSQTHFSMMELQYDVSQNFSMMWACFKHLKAKQF